MLCNKLHRQIWLLATSFWLETKAGVKKKINQTSSANVWTVMYCGKIKWVTKNPLAVCFQDIVILITPDSHMLQETSQTSWVKLDCEGPQTPLCLKTMETFFYRLVKEKVVPMGSDLCSDNDRSTTGHMVCSNIPEESAESRWKIRQLRSWVLVVVFLIFLM